MVDDVQLLITIRRRSYTEAAATMWPPPGSENQACGLLAPRRVASRRGQWDARGASAVEGATGPAGHPRRRLRRHRRCRRGLAVDSGRFWFKQTKFTARTKDVEVDWPTQAEWCVRAVCE